MKAADKQYLIDQCRDYRERANGCEVSKILQVSEEFQKWCNFHKMGGYACHHIWGRSGRAAQAWCNLSFVSTASHEWAHQRGVDEFNVGYAFEAACLLSKHGLQQQMLVGPIWMRETKQHRQHWDVEAMDAVRRTCVGWTSLKDRVEMLHDSLRDTVMGGISRKLLNLITP